MHPAYITAALKKAGSSQAEIARQLQIKRPGVCAVIHGKKRSRRVEQAISQTTGVPISKLWPRRKAA